MAKSPEAIAAAAVARIQHEAFQAGLKQGRTEGYQLGWEACVEKVTNAVEAMPSPSRAVASMKSQAVSDSSKSATESLGNELEIQQWTQLGVSEAPEAAKSYWELQPDFLDKGSHPIDDLELRVNTYNCLKREAVHTVEDITKKSVSDFFDIRNFAGQSFRDLYIAMERYGYKLVTREE